MASSPNTALLRGWGSVGGIPRDKKRLRMIAIVVSITLMCLMHKEGVKRGGREGDLVRGPNPQAMVVEKPRKSKTPRGGRTQRGAGRTKRAHVYDRSMRPKSKVGDGRSSPSPGSAKNISKIFVNSRWQLIKKIGNGAFGVIYKARCNQTRNDVAIKMEKLKAHSQLHFEQNIFKIMQGPQGLPNVYWYGPVGHYNAMTATLLGPSLQRAFEVSGNKLSLKTILMIGIQMVSRLQHLHDNHFIHGDVKPDNFVMGLNTTAHVVHIIDFGLAKKYRHPITRKHVAWSQRDGLEGTARYASINAHKGIQQSRRDDMESLAYVLIYFYQGKLPWQGLKAQTKKEKYQQILGKKSSMSPTEVTEGCPEVFEKLLIYTRNLGFDQDPDYDQIRGWFSDLFREKGYEMDYQYDWNSVTPSTTGAPER